MKPTIFLLLFVLSTAATQTAIGQNVPGTKPSTSQVDVLFPGTNTNAQSRRAAAINKVQQKAAPIPMEYGDETASLRPVEYNATPTTKTTTVTVNGELVEMKIKKGNGQTFNGIFTPVAEQFFIQFGVFCKNTPVNGAPPVEGVLLIWHPGSKCPGWTEGDEIGAIRLVKGFATEVAAKAAMASLEEAGIVTTYKGQLGAFEILATN